VKEKDSEKRKPLKQNEDELPFGDPPIMFNYKCRDCNFISDMNEAHIDVAYGWTKKRTTSSHGEVPVLECPNCGNMAFICVD
jgi:predicted RNA-binding Zn-ribbon protein involved in translation (DUF1610 family)